MIILAVVDQYETIKLVGFGIFYIAVLLFIPGLIWIGIRHQSSRVSRAAAKQIQLAGYIALAVIMTFIIGGTVLAYLYSKG